ncbi:hypothetical protein J4Q44_G00341090 [Coregonus suidteri]|uniref:Kinesin-like KIF1-type domain-containing protein n=1 Tax=Coregonus suidteri TaxID=861788 RepID=A0AAN8KPA8_9TELE
MKNRLVDMRELYQEWKNYDEDNPVSLQPCDADLFFDEQENHSLIGVANVFLACLFYDVKLQYAVPIINQKGEVRGASPCRGVAGERGAGGDLSEHCGWRDSHRDTETFSFLKRILWKEGDLERLREQWLTTLTKRQEYLDQHLQKMVQKPDKSEDDVQRETQLLECRLTLTEERNAVLVPSAGSGIPGAPAERVPVPGMETHIPVLFLDLSADDFSRKTRLLGWLGGLDAMRSSSTCTSSNITTERFARRRRGTLQCMTVPS